MNIEVGEYIRTEIGTIGKVVRINEAYFTIENNRGEIDVIYEGNQKHSKNIIDLIEIGDVVKTGVNKSFLHILATRKDLEHFKKVYKNKQDLIKSIVTKQQFSNMEYRL